MRILTTGSSLSNPSSKTVFVGPKPTDFLAGVVEAGVTCACECSGVALVVAALSTSVGGEWPLSVLSTAVVVRGDVPTVESAMAAVSVGHSSSVSVVTVIGVGGDPFSFAEVDSNRVLCLRILLLASCWSLGLLALFCAIAFFGILTGGVAECAKEKKKERARKMLRGPIPIPT